MTRVRLADWIDPAYSVNDLRAMSKETATRHRCTRCFREIEPGQERWLELDQRTNTYTARGVPPEHSQGGFPFGTTCAEYEETQHATFSPGTT